jgi:hypothetical protein
MIENNQKTSLLVSSQLPEFIRDNPSYDNFVLFLKAYYEWMELNNNPLDRSKNLMNYVDVDKTTDEFIDYFYNEFLVYFPKDILGDKRKVAKIAKELYNSKGTPASYEFLFKVLYNSPVNFFYTKDAVLRASAGKWYSSKSLNLDTQDPNFLLCKSYYAFGETTQSLSVIENVMYAGSKTVLYISNVERGFNSGEYIRILDNHYQDVLFNGAPLRAKVVGQVTQVNIDENNRGHLYNPGDPVIVYGGLNSNTGIGASASVQSTTKGSITSIRVVDEGYGYRVAPNTLITISGGSTATATVTGVDTDPNKTSNVSLVPINTIGNQANIRLNSNNYNFTANITANLNCSLVNAFSFISFTTYPISAIVLDQSGSGFSTAPTVVADSLYQTDNTAIVANIRTLGILAPIQIQNAGKGYRANDTIILNGGSGYGAHANITSVNANGSIVSVRYTYTNPSSNIQYYPLGGIAYNKGDLPVVSIVSGNVAAANAVLTVPGILGDGALFSTTIDAGVGAIFSIQVNNPGKDYVSQPGVSVRVQDICVSNVSILNLPSKTSPAYQGTNFASATYTSYVDGLTSLISQPNSANSLYNLRVYNYNTDIDPTKPLKIDTGSGTITLKVATNYASYNAASQYTSNGTISYGDGSAQASAAFLNGLVTSQGQYLDTTGHLSSFDVLQSQDYNDYTYEITLEKEIAKYKNILLNLLHPTGMKVLGRYVMKSEVKSNFTEVLAANYGHTLGYYTGNPGSSITMVSDFTNASNNLVQFNSLSGANLQGILVPGNSLRMTDDYGFTITSDVVSINAANTVTITDNVWLTYANVAYITANSGANVINITTITNSYDIINNGNYTNPYNKLIDIVRVGDKVLVANNTQKTVTSINSANGKIYVDSNFANNSVSLLSVNRTFTTTNVQIFGPIGTQYFPQLITEDSIILITEDGNTILLG